MPDVSSIPTLDLLILAGYLGGTALFGAWFVGRTRTMEAFTLGNRALPGWAVGISILGTYLSSISFWPIPASPMRRIGARLSSL
jgi:SSS family solute:Na+ symporter